MTTSASVGRTLPKGLAAIVADLEMDQRVLVTTADLETLRLRSGIDTPAKHLALRLRERGWLLPTARRGVYEFAPGAHAGALSSRQVTLPLQAVLLGQPDLNACLTLQSAAWALDLADRAPARLEVAAADSSTTERLRKLLRDDARVLTFAPRLARRQTRGVPTMVPESVLVHMAARPRDVRSWASTLEWLPDLAAELQSDPLGQELAGRPASVSTRAGYLLCGLRPDLTALVVTPGHGNVYLGARTAASRRHDARLQLTDTMLPFDPRTLASVAP